MSFSVPAGLLCQSRGIHSLPVELLTRIFALGAGFDYLYEESPFLLKPNQDYYSPPPSFQLLVSHVCHRWRQVALRTPSLWTTVHLREPVHLARARAYLDRCSTSAAYLLDILVDTVAPEEHIPGVTLCLEEIVEVFDLIIPHVQHWRSFHLKVRSNECKLQARRYLSTCGPAPSLETLQLYHFEDYSTSQDLWIATYRPPVVVFNNSVPKLRNVSLIGVNLPWLKSPYLMNLQKLELALHPDNIRPPYDSWDRMLRLSPQLQSLYLHYSGPRLESGEPSSAWTPTKEKIALDMLSDLRFTDLDPDYLCGVVERLYLPSARKMSWDLPEQDFTPFIELLSRKTERHPSEASGSSGEVSSTAGPTKRRSKIAISSLLSGSDPEVLDESDGVLVRLPRPDVLFEGPLPHLGRLETLAIAALECSLLSWQTLLQSMDGLKRLEVDFRRVRPESWKVFAGAVEVDSRGALRLGSSRLLLPRLQTFKVAGVSGVEAQREMTRRAKTAGGEGGLGHWIIRWSPGMKGEDTVLDELVQHGYTLKEDGRSDLSSFAMVKVETYFEDDEEELDEEPEPDGSQDEDSLGSP
ncbi:hypothetical protein DFP72DRAFT_239888 [Ephemerocybe angulata]|uniref:F-box domain-containing protein n=1 Tax=Ephemerocybe angulata TaxID=980116 RepID=A0A8H6I469_9AGAR|nr:hypothetical protein DFP72DRAFT_239888 [Tulosesus angulatus]